VRKFYFVLLRVLEILKTHKRAWIITLIGGGIFMISYFHRVNIAAFSNYLMRDIKISAASLGILTSSYFYIYGFEQIISGTLSDVIKPKRLIVFSGVLMAIGSFLFYFAFSLNIALWGRILIGVGAGFSFVPLLSNLNKFGWLEILLSNNRSRYSCFCFSITVFCRMRAICF